MQQPCVTEALDQSAAAPRRANASGQPSLRFAIVMPVYNHGASVGKVLEDILAAVPVGLIIAVDDGSRDATGSVLDQLAQQTGKQPGGERLKVVRHPVNRGKGAALETGFAAALAAGCSHAVTIDADGQHLVTDMMNLLAAAAEHPEDLIIGDRQMDQAHVPARSRRGRDMSRFWLWLQTGQDVPDSQCGLRVYPLQYTTRLRHWFKRFDFETETLVRHAWAGLTIRSTPITCIYFPPETRVTHFRPVRDTLRGVRLNVMLTTSRIVVPWTPRKLKHTTPPPDLADKPAAKLSWWSRRGLHALWQHLLHEGTHNAEIAAALGIGVLIGVIPLYGLQTLLAIYVAEKLHLNSPVCVLGTQVALPPLMPFWLLVNTQVGYLLLHGGFVPWHPALWRAHPWTTAREFIAPLALGSLIVGMAAGTATVVAARMLLARYRPAKRDFSCSPEMIQTPQQS